MNHRLLARTPDFAAFDRRAKAGERLNVVFFGASLTWGANASDPLKTSYRANVARRFEAAYPDARFQFFDGAIGGTGSQLGVFRLERDVLRHHPDLVFLDFSANDDIYKDDPETLASYESLVRRLVTEAKVPVVQVIFPFGSNIKPGEMAKMKRRDAHLKISRAYNTSVGDGIALINERVESGKTKIETVWPLDFGHPGDRGYELFAEAAWSGFQNGVAKRLVCAAPPTMLYASTYLKPSRVRLSSLPNLPQGWRVGIPNRTSAYFDFLMSRWLDDVIIASNRTGKDNEVPQEVGRLKIRFRASTAMLLGETTPRSGRYRVWLDGKNHAEFDAGQLARAINGNGHHAQVLATGLDQTREHTLEIEPLFEADKEQELRIESLCVAAARQLFLRRRNHETQFRAVCEHILLEDALYTARPTCFTYQDHPTLGERF